MLPGRLSSATNGHLGIGFFCVSLRPTSIRGGRDRGSYEKLVLNKPW